MSNRQPRPAAIAFRRFKFSGYSLASGASSPSAALGDDLVSRLLPILGPSLSNLTASAPARIGFGRDWPSAIGLWQATFPSTKVVFAASPLGTAGSPLVWRSGAGWGANDFSPRAEHLFT